MSIKIYKGFAVDSADFFEILKMVKEFQEIGTELQREVLADWLKKFDNREDGLKEWIVRRREIQRTGMRDPIVDTDFNAVFFPTLERVTYGIVYCEHPTWFNRWIDQFAIVRDFSYWNNSDRPEDVSEEQWDYRSEVWKHVLAGRGIPAENGFYIELGSVVDPMYHRS